jgi:hypothetical protein
MGNEISVDVGMPEYLVEGDITKPMPVSNMDAAIIHGSLTPVKREQKLQSFHNTFDTLRPGGLLFYEDLGFD